MTARTARRRLSAGVLWGGFGVLAWAAFTLFAGGSTAHADEQNDSALGELLSGVTQTVTTPVSSVVTEVVSPVVTSVVAPVQQVAPAATAVVSQVVQHVPVVGPAAASVVQTATDTVESITTPVTDLLQNDPLNQIADPVLDVVSDVPIVGDVVEDLGLPGVVDDTLGLADDVIDVVGGVVGDTVPPVLGGLDPSTPAGPGSPVPPPTPAPAPVIGAETDGGPGAVQSALPVPLRASAAPPEFPAVTPPVRHAHAAPSGASLTAAAPALTDGAAPTAGDSPTHLPSGSPATQSSSPSGAGAFTSAGVVDGGAPALHAGALSSSDAGDGPPSSPLADTDVSPD